jgi:hypothetical protein
MVKHVEPIVIAKSTLAYTNCGKTGHLVVTCHKRKKEVPIVPTTIVMSTEPIARTKTQLVKSRKIPIHYPCIICYSVEHRYGECPRKTEVYNMFRTKLVSFNVTITPKLLKTNNVLIIAVVVVTTHSYNQNNRCSKKGS